VHVSQILLELDVTNAKPENMGTYAINNVLQIVKVACLKKFPDIVQTNNLKIASLMINVTLFQDSTVTWLDLLAVKPSNARKVTVNAHMDFLIILLEDSAINACLASVILLFSLRSRTHPFYIILKLCITLMPYNVASVKL
jgi:hypothetical protein